MKIYNSFPIKKKKFQKKILGKLDLINSVEVNNNLKKKKAKN